MSQHDLEHGIRRSDLLSLEAYEQRRDALRADIIAIKKRRRILVGPHMSLLFESRQTVLFQIQEVLRIEGIEDEGRIARELATYGVLCPGPGVVAATLFLELTSRAQACAVLAGITDLDGHTFLRVGPHRLAARYVRAPGEPRLMPVSYLHIPVGSGHRALLARGDTPVAFEIDHPAYCHGTVLSEVTRRELAADLGMTRASRPGTPSADSPGVRSRVA